MSFEPIHESHSIEHHRYSLILEQLHVTRSLSDKEFKVFGAMVSLNEQNFSRLSVQEMMEKHQQSLNYILSVHPSY